MENPQQAADTHKEDSAHAHEEKSDTAAPSTRAQPSDTGPVAEITVQIELQSSKSSAQC
ncbi:hypothetical protein Tcan_01894 [Toxocara canis]|uniref:Uncharacterized protein n=1 Tax=Toxocara canis TaxID=6265 RepID=A0A0B2UYK3_TOXCA|nr:hypothetical protein Tcan_01894 [Toxocara canis]